jgi:hypothetical protein
MTKEELKRLLIEYGDATITYRSANSNKLKYNVCTIDFNNDYIQSKNNRSDETSDTVLMFCWDCDSFRLMKPENVKSVVPLSSILKNGE